MTQPQKPESVNKRIEHLKTLAFNDFGDNDARSGNSYIETAVAVKNAQTQQTEVVIHKTYGTHDPGCHYHSVAIANDGKSRLFSVHPNDRSNWMAKLVDRKSVV
mgnify:CR=1 FL=1